MANDQFKMLFSPFKIGNMEVKNRVVTTAHAVNFGTFMDGEITQRYIDYEVAKAKGGYGMIILEATSIDSDRMDFPRGISMWDDRFIPPMRKLTDAVHKYGTKVGMQLWHVGREANLAISKKPLEAPSAIACPTMQNVPAEMTVERIHEVVELFGQASRRVKEAGCDFVELHGGHGYLICGFLSPYSNQRTDQYGGSFENRARFALEIFAAIRKQVGPDFPLGIRISADEWVDGGIKLDEAKEFAKVFAAAGVDYINVSSGNYTFPGIQMTCPSMLSAPGCLVWLAAGIREAVDIPVLTIGRINNPAVAEKILQEGSADLVGMTRAGIADPDWINKAKEGNLDDIRSCVACNQGCYDHLMDNLDITCTVNPAVGLEVEYEIKPADKKKKVMVIGGGPAGLECARVATLRGHDVVLYDERSELGGMNLYAQQMPGRDEFGEVTNYLASQVKKLGVKINLGQKVDVETVKSEQCDAVVVATGASFIIPQIKGVRRADGRLAENVLTPLEVLDKAPVGQNVIIYGAGTIAIETAVLLKQQGKNVVMVDKEPGFVQDMYGMVFWNCVVLPELQELGIELRSLRGIKEIHPGEVVLDNASGLANVRVIAHKLDEETLPADTVVIAVGRQSNNSLRDQLVGLVPEVYAIGDCVEPGLTYSATGDGAWIARQI
ncbi:MAG: FAD-dependent oxidoreductase [Syntrophomonadaceae bacterium]|nr:FAD-dependent oxidoreductase [Syntrophomonadaceae bacterium]